MPVPQARATHYDNLFASARTVRTERNQACLNCGGEACSRGVIASGASEIEIPDFQSVSDICLNYSAKVRHSRCGLRIRRGKLSQSLRCHDCHCHDCH